MNKELYEVIYKDEGPYKFAFKDNIFEENLIFSKDKLHELVKIDNPKIFKKYFMNQITIKKVSDISKFMKKNKLYIVKPIPSSGGFGIKVFKNPEAVKKHMNETKITNKEKILFKTNTIKKWVIQEYIENPLLLNGKKFHIRVMLLNLNKLNKNLHYIFDNYLIYPAEKKYNKNSLNIDIHNSHGSGFSKKDLYKYYVEFNKIDISKRNLIKKQIIEIGKYLKKFINEICFQETKNCYQYAGIDIMITNNYEAKCIEINKRPGVHGPTMFKSFFKGLLDLTILNKDFTDDYTEI